VSGIRRTARSVSLISLLFVVRPPSPGFGQAVQAPTSQKHAATSGDDLHLGHLGLEVRDLEKTIHFYHDLLGTDLLGPRNQQRPFRADISLLKFVDAPAGAEFRDVILSIQGTTTGNQRGTEMTVEAIEYRNVERRVFSPRLQDPGASHLGLTVRDLDSTLSRLRAESVPIITAGGQPVTISPRPGLMIRAVFVRDPDGYPVELLEQNPVQPTSAPAGSNILGAHIAVVVHDIETTLRFYRNLIGHELKTQIASTFSADNLYNSLANTPKAQFRLGAAFIPGSPVVLEFLQYRNVDREPMRPRFQDIGVAHVLFMVKDMDTTMDRFRSANLKTLSKTGQPVYLSPTVRAVLVTDPDGFPVEFMERKE